MSEKAVKILNEIGLTPNEAKVYYAILTLGPTSVLKISYETEIKRSTIYPILNALIEKGLVNIQTKGVKQVYAAESPEKLDAVLDKRKQLLHEILPSLTSLYYNLKGSESFIKHYKGVESIKSLFNQLLDGLKPGDFFLVISDKMNWVEYIPDHFQGFVEKRAQRGLHSRLLLQDSPFVREFKQNEAKYDVKIKILPNHKPITTHMSIVHDKVIIIQTTPPFMAMVIENDSVIQMNRFLFEMIWDALEDDA